MKDDRNEYLSSILFSRQTWSKVNVSWMSNGDRINYQQKKVFHFRRDLSAGGEDMLLTLPNVPMIVSCNCNFYNPRPIVRARQ